MTLKEYRSCKRKYYECTFKKTAKIFLLPDTFAPDDLRLIGDLHHYQQILANLVDNAIKFTKDGGRVDVLLAPCDHPDRWQMVVRDTGMGIPPERLSDIFLPFRRASEASDYKVRGQQGLGLDLSIAKRITQVTHGDIEVKSTVGQGSIFTVTLPVKLGV